MDHPHPLGGPRSFLTPGPGWPDRSAVVRDVFLTLGFYLLMAAELYALSVLDILGPWQVLGALIGPVVVVLLGRLHPLLAPCAAMILGYLLLAFVVVLTCASYLAGRRSPKARPVAILIVFAVVVFADVWRSGMGGEPVIWILSLLVTVLSVAVPWLVGVYRRQHVELIEGGWEQARRSRREQRLTADQARMRERSRIARDMHDSLGHELTLIALRAGALEVARDLDERHREKVVELRETAVSATRNLREIIGVLNDDEGERSAPTGPAGESVVALVERVRDSGLRVMLVQEGPMEDLAPMVDRAAHRVVQESLTNVVKYAPESRATVRLTADSRRLAVHVTNTATEGASGEGAVSGHRGLAGLRERVRLTGGTFAAGPAENGWEVCAILPLDGEAVPDEEIRTDGAAEIDRLRHNARRGVRNWSVALFAAPIMLLMAVAVLMYLFVLDVLTESTLSPQDYAEVEVGRDQDELAPLLPAYPLDQTTQLEEVADPDPDCDQYRVDQGASDTDADFYQLCYEDGVLVSKEELRGP
ncbi:sensor histidine kinase [Nocardiopsis sp. NPDC055551]|uniref:sensor histidine kinase n=1 Tax=Nocardiopsis sp. NPDC006832 TaxID=3157188 RepID=UPI0033C238D1